jgi:hypothetical protein
LNNILILDSRHWRIIQRRGTLARLGFAARRRVELSAPPPTSISRYFCEVQYPYYESENTLVTSMMSGKPDLLHICVTPPIIWSELDTMFIECKCMPKGLYDWIFGGVWKRAGNNAANTRNCVPGKRSHQHIAYCTHMMGLPYTYEGNFYLTRESALESTSGFPRIFVSSFKRLPSETNLLFVVAR